jgi:LAO/AO transport system kinase
MDLQLDDAHRQIQQMVRDFCEEEVKSQSRKWDETGEFPFETVRKLGELGLMGITVPEEYGGAGLDMLAVAVIIEEIARYDGSLALTVASHNGLGTSQIRHFGTEAQRQRWVPPLARGEKLAAWGLTEPGSGSDAAGLLSTAVRKGEGWVVNGSKMFITQGSVGHTFVVLARTSPEKAQKGITAFVLEKHMKGFSQRVIHGKLGMRSSDTAELIMEDVEVPDENRIGAVDHGFLDTLSILDRGRTGRRAGAGSARGGPRLRQGAQGVRQAHRRVPGHRLRAGRHGHRGGRGQASGVALGHAGRCQGALRSRGLDGKALRERGGHARHQQGRPDPGRLRVHAGVPGRALLPRRQALRDRGGNERDPAHGHRPLDPARRMSGRSPTIADRVWAGDVRTAARLMRNLDDGLPGARKVLRELFARPGHAFVVGITGPPGAGKSSLTDRLIALHRRAGKTVGVVAVDPTSPFTGGAILGDRVRMQDHALDPGVFIRSLATRGHLGGLSRATADVVEVLDAMGKDVILVETVGVGQDEVEVAELAHSVVVVSVPGMGDEVQAIKAGVLEIADIFAVNKADREGADRTVKDLQMMLDLRRTTATRSVPDHDANHQMTRTATEDPHDPGWWEPPIVKTVATRDEGVVELAEAVELHRQHLERTGERKLREVARARSSFLTLLRDRLMQRALSRLAEEEGHLDELAARIADRSADPYQLADELAARL